MVADPDDFDAKIAGWWVWGQSSWIGHGWCDGKAAEHDTVGRSAHWRRSRRATTAWRTSARRCRTAAGAASARSGTACRVTRCPECRATVAARACSSSGTRCRTSTTCPAARASACSGWRWVTPCRSSTTCRVDGGVSHQRIGADRHGGESPLAETDGVLDGSRLRPWFRAIAERLARVIILNRSWESALTDSVLQQTPASPKPSVGVFLDPPYRTTRAGRRQAVDRPVPGRQRRDSE